MAPGSPLVRRCANAHRHLLYQTSDRLTAAVRLITHQRKPASCKCSLIRPSSQHLHIDLDQPAVMKTTPGTDYLKSALSTHRKAQPGALCIAARFLHYFTARQTDVISHEKRTTSTMRNCCGLRSHCENGLEVVALRPALAHSKGGGNQARGPKLELMTLALKRTGLLSRLGRNRDFRRRVQQESAASMSPSC